MLRRRAPALFLACAITASASARAQSTPLTPCIPDYGSWASQEEQDEQLRRKIQQLGHRVSFKEGQFRVQTEKGLRTYRHNPDACDRGNVDDCRRISDITWIPAWQAYVVEELFWEEADAVFLHVSGVETRLDARPTPSPDNRFFALIGSIYADDNPTVEIWRASTPAPKRVATFQAPESLSTACVAWASSDVLIATMYLDQNEGLLIRYQRRGETWNQNGEPVPFTLSAEAAELKWKRERH